MTYAPASLQNLRSYLVGMGQPVVGIVGDEAHTGGYHLGRDRLRLTDYSRQLYRDRLGLTNAASAIDIGMSSRLRELSNWLVAESKAGRARDIREVIYSPDGAHVLRWDAANSRTVPNSDLSHLSHTHISYYRDSEYVDKRPLYVRFYQPEDDVRDFTFIYDDGKMVTGQVVVADEGTKYLDLSDNQLKSISVGTAKEGVKVRLTTPISAGHADTEANKVGWLIGTNAAFVLDRNVKYTPNSYVVTVGGETVGSVTLP